MPFTFGQQVHAFLIVACSEIERRTHPRTPADFAILYNELEGMHVVKEKASALEWYCGWRKLGMGIDCRFGLVLGQSDRCCGKGGPKTALRGGGGGMAWAPCEGGGGEVPEMGFRAGPFVLCKDGCCHQRRRNTNFGLENFFHEKIFPHICVVKMMSATWGSF